jgi:hypothetical protein
MNGRILKEGIRCTVRAEVPGSRALQRRPVPDAGAADRPADAVSSTGMGTRPRSQAGAPMTLGNMRANGVRSLDVCCWLCHHRAILSADPWPDHVPVRYL